MNDLDEPPPNVKTLRNLADDGVIDSGQTERSYPQPRRF
jgi:hypothetical protein